MKEVSERPNGTRRVKIIFEDLTSRVKQSMRDECDINNIMRKYKKNGKLPDMIKQNPAYGDFSNVRDYKESMEIVMRAEEQFDALPHDIKLKCQNDPAKFLAYVVDPANRQELEKYGIVRPKAPVPSGDAGDPAATPPPAPAGAAAASPQGGKKGDGTVSS